METAIKNVEEKEISLAQNSFFDVFLNEDLGFVDSSNQPVNIGTWDKTCRLATLYPDQTLVDYVLIPQVHYAVIDGNNSNLAKISVHGYNNLLIKNFKITASYHGIVLMQSSYSMICNNTLEIMNNGIVINTCNNCSIVENNITAMQIPGLYIHNIHCTSSTNITICKNNIAINFVTPPVLSNTPLDFCLIHCEALTCSCIDENLLSISNNYIDNTTLLTAYTVNIIAIHFVRSCVENKINHNTINMDNNTIKLHNPQVTDISSLKFIAIYLNNNNSSNCFTNNVISMNSNLLDINTIGLYPNTSCILLDSNNNLNIIDNNKLTLSLNNIINHSLFYLQLIAINLNNNNNGNKLTNLHIELMNNTVSNPQQIVVLFTIYGIHFLEYNVKNLISCSTIKIINNTTTDMASLIKFYLYNSSNEISYNDLSDSQGDGITFINHNNISLICSNRIENNNRGIYLFDNYNSTNQSTIKGNCIVNNRLYGLYITNGNPFNIITCNNFINTLTPTSTLAFDTTPIDKPTLYDGNYWSDYSGSVPYAIQPIPHYDNNPELNPLPLCCPTING